MPLLGILGSLIMCCFLRVSLAKQLFGFHGGQSISLKWNSDEFFVVPGNCDKTDADFRPELCHLPERPVQPQPAPEHLDRPRLHRREAGRTPEHRHFHQRYTRLPDFELGEFLEGSFLLTSRYNSIGLCGDSIDVTVSWAALLRVREFDPGCWKVFLMMNHCSNSVSPLIKDSLRLKGPCFFFSNPRCLRFFSNRTAQQTTWLIHPFVPLSSFNFVSDSQALLSVSSEPAFVTLPTQLPIASTGPLRPDLPDLTLRSRFSRTSLSIRLWYFFPWSPSRSSRRRARTRWPSASTSKPSNLVPVTRFWSSRSGSTAPTTLSRDKSDFVLNGAWTISVSCFSSGKVVTIGCKKDL